jgi:hypothetical protein
MIGIWTSGLASGLGVYTETRILGRKTAIGLS